MPTTPDSVFDPLVDEVIAAARAAAGGAPSNVRRPFPSPADWRDHFIYFLMIDRFNHPSAPPREPGLWNRAYGFRQGGTFKGIQAKLDYLAGMGVGAIWLTPVVKNPAPPAWAYNYHGYAAQDLLAIDARFASDGTRQTAERELRELVDAAHDRGIYVILDVVLNHMARVFDYWRDQVLVDTFKDVGILRSPPLSGLEPEIAWLNGQGFPRPDWTGVPPAPAAWHADDGAHPAADIRKDFFRRRGEKTSDEPDWPAEEGGLAVGDFGVMRQLAVEYAADARHPLHQRWGANPVLTLLVRAYSYLVARFDFDAFRIDTVKYVQPTMVQFFGNAIREFALSIGKRNFYTVGEVWDDDQTIARFVGRNGNVKEGFGIDAAKDFPLFQLLKAVVKGLEGGEVEKLPALFDERKAHEAELLSTHGEASRFFVTFLDNHDQRERFRHPATPDEQVTLALGLLFTLQGIPCVYYGTEQDLSGTVDEAGNPAPADFEGVREALWGKPDAFATNSATYRQIQALAGLRARLPALRYGRQYFRPVSANGTDFGPSRGRGGIIACSRVLGDREVVVVANTSTQAPFTGHVLVDRTLNDRHALMKLAYSNRGHAAYVSPIVMGELAFWRGAQPDGYGPGAHVQVDLRPMELQILEQG